VIFISVEQLVLEISHGEESMLRNMKDLEDYTIGATDGVIGRVKDFYFDDDVWVIRYLVVETGDGGTRRKVLISPIGIGQPNWSEKIFPVAMTRDQVKNSPDIDTEQEAGIHVHYGHAAYSPREARRVRTD
jgi:hypothetical protein